MAIIQDPLHSQRANGKFDNQVFYRDRGINISRSYIYLKQTPSGLQSAQQSILATISALWATLSPGQVHGWELYALLHQRRSLYGSLNRRSAYACFMELNTIRYHYSTDYSLDAPLFETVPLINSLALNSISPGGDGIAAVVTFLINTPSTGWLETFIEGPHASPNTRPLKGKWKLNLQNDISNATGYTILCTPYPDYFWVKVRYVTLSGQPSPFIYGHSQVWG